MWSLWNWITAAWKPHVYRIPFFTLCVLWTSFCSNFLCFFIPETCFPRGPHLFLSFVILNFFLHSYEFQNSSKEILNPMLATLMNSTTSALQLQQMQSLLALDPSLLLQAAVSAPASLLPSPSTTNTSIPKPSIKKVSGSKGRLNAVVEKLSSNQSWGLFNGHFYPL